MNTKVQTVPNSVAVGMSLSLVAILFGFIHLNPWQFFNAVLLGLIFAWLAVKSNTIWLPIIGHFINNSISLLVLEFAPENLYAISEELEINSDAIPVSARVFVISLGLILLISSMIMMNKQFKRYEVSEIKEENNNFNRLDSLHSSDDSYIN